MANRTSAEIFSEVIELLHRHGTPNKQVYVELLQLANKYDFVMPEQLSLKAQTILIKLNSSNV